VTRVDNFNLLQKTAVEFIGLEYPIAALFERGDGLDHSVDASIRDRLVNGVFIVELIDSVSLQMFLDCLSQ
jgi:hypothetical protein